MAFVTWKAFQKPEHANFIINILVEAEARASPDDILSPVNVKLLKVWKPEKIPNISRASHVHDVRLRACLEFVKIFTGALLVPERNRNKNKL